MPISDEWGPIALVITNAVSAVGGGIAVRWLGAKGEQERASVTQLFSRIDTLHAELDSLRNRHDTEMDEVRAQHEACRRENADLRRRLDSLEKKAEGAA